MHNDKTPRRLLQTGQLWKMDGSSLHIGMVGKTLVHYKHYRGATKRAPISLAALDTLEKFLKQNRATLVSA
jgi:hypothetical protein